jgi:hypothetical protein
VDISDGISWDGDSDTRRCWMVLIAHDPLANIGMQRICNRFSPRSHIMNKPRNDGGMMSGEQIAADEGVPICKKS